MKPPSLMLWVAGVWSQQYLIQALIPLTRSHPQPHPRSHHHPWTNYPQPLTLLFLLGIQITDLNIQTIVIAGYRFKAL